METNEETTFSGEVEGVDFQEKVFKVWSQGQTKEVRGQGNRKILTIDENTIASHGSIHEHRKIVFHKLQIRTTLQRTTF